jgi:hypothetical protein
MSQALNASTTVTFQDPNADGREIRLEQDTTRPVEPKTYHTNPYRVTAQDKTFVRLYHGPNVNPVVTAITGNITEVGTDIQRGVVETVTITPDNLTASVPPWATNVTIRVLGRSFSPTGVSTSPAAIYDSARKMVIASNPVYAAIEVKFDAPYRLFQYTFTGACPIDRPRDFDETGNAIHGTTKHFTDGVVFAIDFTKSAHATLTMQGPDCSWGGGGVSGTEAEKSLPRLAMDIHPDYPPRMVATSEGGRAWCECTVRVFPAGVGASVYTTTGTASSSTSRENLEVKDVLLFDNRATQSLSYTPSGSVDLRTLSLYPIRDRYRRYSEGRSIAPVGPGESVTDVDYNDDGVSYSNPRPRTLGPDEVALIDVFRIPSPSLAVVEAEYMTSYDCFTFTFDWDGTEGKWKEAILLAKTEDGRVARLEISPPTTKARNRRFANE